MERYRDQGARQQENRDQIQSPLQEQAEREGHDRLARLGWRLAFPGSGATATIERTVSADRDDGGTSWRLLCVAIFK